jgi:AcrR family transcriptional regulator
MQPKSPTPVTRRERFRQITMDEIKTIARRQMIENGTAGISLNAIARTMEISGPALYRYYASRDALITALGIDAYSALAETLESAAREQPTAPPAERLMAVLMAYRRWAVDHPVEFQLIFGNPIPGYHGPEDIISPVARRVFSPILQILAESFQHGDLKPPSGTTNLPSGLQVTLEVLHQNEPPAIPAEVIYIGLVGWYHIHGMIMLELFNHSTTMINDPALFYRHEVLRLFKSMNLSAD